MCGEHSSGMHCASSKGLVVSDTMTTALLMINPCGDYSPIMPYMRSMRMAALMMVTTAFTVMTDM